ncbi:MAG: HAMP domain-containing sensor histidine kinase [Alphaproteobacteria bacterium]|nr:HAMP domain-containing sensor histidine kinase [Alphaproteobacteria bacterium]
MQRAPATAFIVEDRLPDGGPGLAARALKLQFEQFYVVYKNNTPTAFAMPIFSLIISIMLLEWVPFTHLAWWVAALTVVCGAQGALNALYKRSPTREADTPRWIAAYVTAIVIFSIVWIAPAFLFWSYCGDLGHLLIGLVMACSIAGSAATMSPCPPLAAASLIPYVIALMVPPLFAGTAFYYLLSALGLGFSLFMLHLARQVFLTTRDMLTLREDKNSLIEQLTAAKFESDKARLRAEAASQAKSEFLANMSHELRTPLNAILGFSDIMKGEVFGSLGSTQYLEYSEHIHTSGHHLLGLINDILDLSKIQAGRFSVRAVELNMREAVHNALKLFETRTLDARINFKTDVEKDLPLLLADERGMHQILLNLLSNAVKFTPSGGTVTVFARRASNGGMDVGVADTGVGIDPNDVDAVFEAFGQGRHDIATSEKGTGLGLPIVRGLVEAHGGTIKLDTHLGKGTTFTCWFPRERLTAPQPVPIRLAAVF